MELRPPGNTALKLSCVRFGGSPFGSVYGSVSDEEAIDTVHEAFKLGINFFDTSPYYGGTLSEKVLGKALKAVGVPRNEYIVSTKCGRYKEGFDFSAERVTRSIDESLERLQMEYVDILQCHDIEFGSLDQIINETIPALQKLKETGKIRFVGITGLPLEIFTYVLDRVPLGTVDGVGVISASPLSMGLLTESGPPEWHPASAELQYSLCNKDTSTIVGMKSVEQYFTLSYFSSFIQVHVNVVAATELAQGQIDEQTLAEVEEILKPVKNQTWPSGIQKS
ncbi:NAD(P)-linked oxidoreductase superfamily protein [Artemisia annua]|uniref:NAD(P)-linked oxidoreductase superfamily protein n=1 Tax=Artemisia annua TaxID=35608 RepID=A0A2U1LD26_ARTAN|nr:NAD(P)-linked oxidoreductase superfamily protein [Artemisia annua]